jgi:hypothetical protein
MRLEACPSNDRGTLVGEFVSKGVPDAALKGAVLAFLGTVFDEDQKNLAQM